MDPSSGSRLPEKLTFGKQTAFFSSSERMDGVPAGEIDVIVTSPPYNRGKTYSSDTNEMHDDNMPDTEYFAFLQRVWTECYRVASDRAVFFLNIGDSATDQGLSEKVAQTAIDAGWKRVQDLVWVKSIYGKGHYTPTGSNKRFNNVWEHIFMFAKDLKVYEIDPKSVGIPYADKSNIGRYGDTDLRDPGNVVHICYEKTTGATVKKGHDAPYPIGLPYFCIKAVPAPRAVLDPFLGTGTTLAAAEALEIPGFGFEKYPRIQLIEETITEGKDYEPKPIILLPHYEDSIKALLDLCEAFQEISHKVPSEVILRSKKSRERWAIVVETAEKLGFSSPMILQIKQILGILSKKNKNLLDFMGNKL